MEKSNDIVPEMRERLMTNRSGKLTVSQWVDIVTQPLMSLFVMLVPLTFVIPRLLWGFGFWFIGMLLVVLVAVVLIRAYRYARLPVYFGKMRTVEESAPFWMFWKGSLFEDVSGQEMQFKIRLAPPPRLKRDMDYDVYYLQDNERLILLSVAPSDHPDATRWQPDSYFEKRLKRRQS